MAKERDIRRADKVLRGFRSRIGKRNSRIHKDTMSRNLQRQRALDGLCGDCDILKIGIKGRGVAERVELDCKENTPIELYAGVPLEQEPDCSGYTPRR